MFDYKEWYKNHREEVNAYKRQWYKDNIEKEKEYRRQWREDHREDRREYSKQHYEKHREEILEKCKQYRKENSEKIQEYRRKRHENNPEKELERNRQYYIENRERERERSLKRNYNLSREDWLGIWESQDGECAICGQSFTKQSNANVDHDHETDEVRGLLCNKCNLGIGLFNDDPELLLLAARYLNKFRGNN